MPDRHGNFTQAEKIKWKPWLDSQERDRQAHLEAYNRIDSMPPKCDSNTNGLDSIPSTSPEFTNLIKMWLDPQSDEPKTPMACHNAHPEVKDKCTFKALQKAWKNSSNQAEKLAKMRKKQEAAKGKFD